MARILSLKPEDENKLHPDAVRWLNARIAEIQFEVPLEDLGDDDLNAFLSDDEKCEFIRYKDEITRGLYRCVRKDSVSPDPLAETAIGLSLVTFQVDSLLPMHRIGLLLKHVHQRKTAKVKQEQRERDEEDKRSREQAEAEHQRKEEEERHLAAQKAVSPPLNDAKRYLNEEEYDKFIQAARGAIEVYLEKGGAYLDDVRTFDYCWCLKKISDRKEKEKQKIAARLGAQEYNQRLNKEKTRLKALLCSSRKDHESYFKKQIRNRRYTGQGFTQFLSREEGHDFNRTIVDIGRKKLDEIMSGDFRQFIYSKCWRSYFLLPSAEYSLKGIPCLDFMFDVFAVVEIRVWLKPGQKEYGEYIFDLPWREEKGYSVLLQEPEFLGYHYLVLAPDDFGGHVFWESIPLALLKRLLNGETKPNGFTITAAVDGMITYKVPRFKELVNIPDDFAGYLRSIGSIDEMVSMGIMTQKIASIAQSDSVESKIEHKTSPIEGERRNSRKARAFLLFSQGKRPSDSEIKTLGIKPESAYRYYQDWKKAH